jgi:hypothetical protein
MNKSIYLVSLTILLGISSDALHLHARAKSASDKAAIGVHCTAQISSADEPPVQFAYSQYREKYR